MDDRVAGRVGVRPMPDMNRLSAEVERNGFGERQVRKRPVGQGGLIADDGDLGRFEALSQVLVREDPALEPDQGVAPDHHTFPLAIS